MVRIDRIVNEADIKETEYQCTFQCTVNLFTWTFPVGLKKNYKFKDQIFMNFSVLTLCTNGVFIISTNNLA